MNVNEKPSTDVHLISITCTGPRNPATLPPPARARTGCEDVLTRAYHVGELVGDDGDHALLVAGGGGDGVVQQGRLPVGDQPPVLHGPRIEVRQGDLVWGWRGRGGGGRGEGV